MQKIIESAVLASLLVAAPAASDAAGFAVVEQNASRLGNGYAGGAAESNDASVIFYNPAGMTYLEGRQMSVSALVFLSKVEFNNAGSRSIVGTPLTGGNGGNAASTSLIPNLYYTATAGNGLKFGFAITAPAGVKLNYGANWVGRYYGTGSELEVINISPAVAARIGPNTSVGAALDIQYAHAQLSKAIDFGSFGAALGLVPQQADGMANVTGHDWAPGYHIGIQHEVNPDTRVGFSYRSKVNHRLDGSAMFSNVPGFMASGFQTTRARTDITLPEVISLSGIHKPTSGLTIMGDVTWTHWSRFKELRIRFDSQPPSGDDITLEDWKNTWRYALGVNYQQNSNLMLRAGIARDEGPVRSGRRTPAIPDGTRNSLAFGANYKLSGNGSVDFAYQHLFIPTGDVNLSSPVQGTLTGNYTSHADILGVQYNRPF